MGRVYDLSDHVTVVRVSEPSVRSFVEAVLAGLGANAEAMTYSLTTPLYYVNAKPHLGSVYTTLACDALIISL